MSDLICDLCLAPWIDHNDTICNLTKRCARLEALVREALDEHERDCSYCVMQDPDEFPCDFRTRTKKELGDE